MFNNNHPSQGNLKPMKKFIKIKLKKIKLQKIKKNLKIRRDLNNYTKKNLSKLSWEIITKKSLFLKLVYKNCKIINQLLFCCMLLERSARGRIESTCLIP